MAAPFSALFAVSVYVHFEGNGLKLLRHIKLELDVNLIARYADRILYVTPGHYAVGTVDEVMRTDVLQRLYGTAVELVRLAGNFYLVASDQTVGGGTDICNCNDVEAPPAVPSL